MTETNAVIVAGGVVERDGKYLLIQEAKVKCRGKWNLPAGHVDVGEDIITGAKREIKEETGCDVELTGVCQIGNRKRVDFAFVAIIFTAKITAETITINDPNEILDVKWFSYDEIVAMREQIRNVDLLLGAIENQRQGIVAPLGIIKLYREGSEFQKVTLA